MTEISRKGQRGQSLVEAALTLPLVLLVFMGIFDLSRAVYYQSVVANAAREGARYCAMDEDRCEDDHYQEAKDVILATMAGVDPAAVQIDISLEDECGEDDDDEDDDDEDDDGEDDDGEDDNGEDDEERVCVWVRYRMQIVTPMIATAIGRPEGYLDLASESIMLLEDE